MLGTSMGSLKVYKNLALTSTEVFSVNGNRGDQWYIAQTSLTGPEQFQVTIKRFFKYIFTAAKVIATYEKIPSAIN